MSDIGESYLRFISSACDLLAYDGSDETLDEKSNALFQSLMNGIQGNRSDDTPLDQATIDLLMEKIISILHKKFM